MENLVLTYPHLSPLCPVQVAGACRRPSSIKLLHLILSWASSSLREQDWRSFLIVSFHLCNGRPRFLFPSTLISCTLLMSSSSSLLHTCLNHCNLLFLIKSNPIFTFASCLILSLVLCSSRLIPRQYHHHLTYNKSFSGAIYTVEIFPAIIIFF